MPMAEERIQRTLFCLGVDHHNTPVAVRERLSVSDTAVPGVVQRLRQVPGIDECVLLSTCNRVEVYAAGCKGLHALRDTFAEEVGVDPALISEHAYEMHDEVVARHLFRVVASLESMVIGEYQIQHQIKNAYEVARRSGCTGMHLDALFQYALNVGKAVRTHTSIGERKVSVASVGVDLARHIHGDLSKARMLVVGAGEIAELATVHLVSAGVRRITLINRTHERALNLAKDGRFAAVDVHTVPWSQLAHALSQHDIVVTSTAAERPVITTAEVREARRRCLGPLVIIDLAVPRDVAAEVGELADVYRYDLDHLDHMVAANRDVREDELQAVEALVAEHLVQWQQRQTWNASDLPAAVSQWFAEVLAEETQVLQQRLDPEAAAEARRSVHRLAGKLRHRCLQMARSHVGDPEREALIRQLLDLE
ncbi:MAG: glutamyl-tRNA reductase [Planctomycetota bacterium]|nr:MAG: glutamyl-tRNA reductase [Planctomycetota bacterium]